MNKGTVILIMVILIGIAFWGYKTINNDSTLDYKATMQDKIEMVNNTIHADSEKIDESKKSGNHQELVDQLIESRSLFQTELDNMKNNREIPSKCQEAHKSFIYGMEMVINGYNALIYGLEYNNMKSIRDSAIFIKGGDVAFEQGIQRIGKA